MSHEYYMQEALKEAKIAGQKSEVPIGCVIVRKGEIIVRTHNLREKLQTTASHAEMLAIDKANKIAGSWRLEECTLYATLEPCAMCAGTLLQSRIKTVVFGAYDVKGGCTGTVYNLLSEEKFNHQAEIIGGVLEEECSVILTDFFKKLRAK